ncbi:hypothetical protein DSL72_007194 [Monilinia vaccinii-corymbosi]|uniref:Uncharacterized protein n=1 Tax=Monilinia vaccinii-corymbosi TaxID=61207 RepID=A0A8A3PLR2_9HELO|nr:hypothetical protein DSL72_007194 [Monilinia vaccinii-corymbosi]
MSNDRRLIYRYRRSPSRPRTSNREVINELEEHNAVLHAINESLRTELANVEQRNRQLMSDRSTLREREISYLNEMDRLAERRDRAEARAEDVEERIRLMRRVFTGR